MQGAAHIMMTLDISINFWLTDSYLRVMKRKPEKFVLKNLWQISRSHQEVSEISERYDS